MGYNLPEAERPPNPESFKQWQSHLAGAIRALLYQGESPGRQWTMGRDLSICRQLHARHGHSFELIFEVLQLAAQQGSLPPPPVTMRYFWEHGQAQRFNELAGQVYKERLGAKRSGSMESVGEVLERMQPTQLEDTNHGES